MEKINNFKPVPSLRQAHDRSAAKTRPPQTVSMYREEALSTARRHMQQNQRPRRHCYEEVISCGCVLVAFLVARYWLNCRYDQSSPNPAIK